MVTVAALLTITPGKEEEFEREFAKWGHATLTAAVGNHSATLSRCIEEPSPYLLVSEWDSVDAHKAAMDDPEYMKWVLFARGFYAEPVWVRHFDGLG
ncbi:MAG: antibiotic biosynthesis monooxygenase [Actinobacteria bacterium]|nr:antibiotic biosynthesis monooxygenase [Actinomycetota bacterium]